MRASCTGSRRLALSVTVFACGVALIAVPAAGVVRVQKDAFCKTEDCSGVLSSSGDGISSGDPCGLLPDKKQCKGVCYQCHGGAINHCFFKEGSECQARTEVKNACGVRIAHACVWDGKGCACAGRGAPTAEPCNLNSCIEQRF